MTDIDLCIAGRMRMLTRVVTGLYNETFSQEGVTFTQATLLMYAFALPGVRQSVLSKQFVIEKSALSRDLQLLQRNGWLTDNIKKGLFLTDEGRALAKRCHKRWKTLNSDVREQLGPAAIDGLDELASRLLTIANKGV
ncbi:winged helix-turn-helix transcriptional regulator [Fibrella sp. HMF5335]|uniref:Winged helix-turn-helix transcriptional regulator n=1 Tax=Fibrella rubiginis TaxID=2817060 RepID=A0A939GJC6_9BACT|nr:MarR family winged helix-turn-helix transcriptional regulator [Fibrella rubiginis]MBO0938510.1 winged helix-turn-helix transcriptional regulator [Fibrella rubiginis]